MYLLFSIAQAVEFVLLRLPRILRGAARDREVLSHALARFYRFPELEPGGRPVVWLHCICVGEVQVARPLARAILREFPSYRLVVSTTSRVGQRLARELLREEAASVFYFPNDWAWTVRRALRCVNPSVVLIMERELWPHFLRECRRRGVGAALINGRLSESALGRYRHVAGFMSRTVSGLDIVIAQTEADAERLRRLGVAADRLHVSGNMKFDVDAGEREQALTDEMRRRFAFREGQPLLVAASTHAPEERVVVEAFRQARAGRAGLRPRMVVAPRRPERFDEVASVLSASGLTWARRSAPPRDEDADCDVVLLDSIGELRSFFPLADIVFVGGSIAPRGGHNVLEPAAAGACVVTGAHTANFAAAVGALLEADALVQLPQLTPAEAPRLLAQTLTDLWSDGERRRGLAARARAVVDQNRGATRRTVELLGGLLSARARV